MNTTIQTEAASTKDARIFTKLCSISPLLICGIRGAFVVLGYVTTAPIFKEV